MKSWCFRTRRLGRTAKSKLDLYHVGDAIEGKISGVVDFGCFVEFGEGRGDWSIFPN